MRLRPCLPLLLAVLLVSCGYVGEPLPPALKRPVRVADLTAVERGPKIIIQFTVPTLTTENLPIKGNPDMELRIGSVGDSFQPDAWARTSERITGISSDKGAARAEVPASKYQGQRVAIGVNVHGPDGRTVGWSNFAPLTVGPPLEKPQGLEAKDGPDSIVLDWHSSAPEFRIFRKTVAAPDWTRIGTASKPEYADSTIEYGQTYQYYVQAQQREGEGYSESDDSDVTTFKPVDKFPPAVPAGITAVPGTRSIELLWDRNTERDFASYRVYRNGQRLPEAVTSPAYSDRDVQPGTKYEYQVTAVDTAGNESAKSARATAEIP